MDQSKNLTCDHAPLLSVYVSYMYSMFNQRGGVISVELPYVILLYMILYVMFVYYILIVHNNVYYMYIIIVL